MQNRLSSYILLAVSSALMFESILIQCRGVMGQEFK